MNRTMNPAVDAMKRYCEVYVQHPIFEINQTYTYACDCTIQVGQRVLVPFGQQEIIGLVHAIHHEIEETNFEIKPIKRAIDDTILLNEELYAIAKWLEMHTIAPYMACIQAMLPTLLKPKKAKKMMGKAIKLVKVNEDHGLESFTPKEKIAYEYLHSQGPLTYTEFRSHFTSVAKRMITKGYITLFETTAQATLDTQQQSTPLTLNEEQAAALQIITTNPQYHNFLLHGVTGSGKTEVYLQSASEVIAQGKQVLILVPEISLTSQMIDRVKRRFNNKVAGYHSRLNPQERYEQYQLVLNGQVQIAVGTRSAIFLPFTDLGLIILDEEHDKSYKQENLPRYHAKDIAQVRGQYHNCPVIFASATPSLEAYARAIKGVYTLIELKKRVNETLPVSILVDMREENRCHHFKKLSRPLMAAMEHCLAHGEQIILLMNRRGYVPILRCKKCKQVVQCPHCDISLSYHKQEEKLKCHYCDYEQSYPKTCGSCQYTIFEWLGYGIQLLEEEVKQTFPNAKIMRMDRDTTTKKNSHQTLINAFANHEADILLGTQMIAKGLDFENVTCVGILNADAGLYRSDFRAIEDTFQLVTQACGRSGRADKAGKVFIQTVDTSHYALQLANVGNYRGFFQKEMRYRHLGDYPPYCYLASVVISHKKEDELQSCVLAMRQFIKASLLGNDKLYGPPDLIQVKDQYRKQMLIKSKDSEQLETVLRAIMQEFKPTQKQAIKIEVDMNPSSLE